jgi:hypothetical protein
MNVARYTSDDGAIICENIDLTDFRPGDERILWLWVNPSLEYVHRIMHQQFPFDEVNEENAGQALQMIWSFVDLFNKGPEGSLPTDDQVFDFFQEVRNQDPELFRWIIERMGRKLAAAQFGMSEEKVTAIVNFMDKHKKV